MENGKQTLIVENEALKLQILALLQESKEKERILEQEKNYIHTLVHDLRSPLSRIISFSELLLEEDDLSNKDKKEFTQIISNTSDQMLKMMQGYLSLQKFENKNKLNKELISVLDLIKEIRKIFTDKKSFNKLRLIFKNCKENSVDLNFLKREIEIDRSLFLSAITNLLNNAIEASDNSDVTINFFEEKNLFCIAISNKGEIPEEIKKTLFKKFFTSKKYGTGLGLFSSKLIAEAHGGDLVYVPISNGTSFVFKIPFN